MSYGFGFVENVQDNLGQTVSIFTTSGGQSGSGFTGVLANANNDFVRLVNQIGQGPGCALGNCCEGFDSYDGYSNAAMNCGRNMLGTVVDIPYDKMAAFVHNAVGSHW